MYYKKGRVGGDLRAEEKLEWKGHDDAVEEFARFFQEINGNDFESQERKEVSEETSDILPR